MKTTAESKEHGGFLAKNRVALRAARRTESCLQRMGHNAKAEISCT